MKNASRQIPVAVAERIARNLFKRLGPPESSCGAYLGKWHSEVAYRFRRDDGSTWARLGFGPTRKMVVLSFVEGNPVALLSIHQAQKAA